MIFNADVKRCVSKSGERCKFEIMGTRMVETNGCSENANCSDDGICVCNPGYYENSNQTCTEYKKYGETCSKVHIK